MIEISPVLTFSGNCEEAFKFYKAVFNSEYQFIYRYKDVDPTTPAEYQEKIMHISLPLMKNVNLMGTDDPDKTNTKEGIVSIGIRLNNKEETFELFNKLSDNGKVITPLSKVFYADYYGMVIDKFGVFWSFNCNIGREM